MGNPDWENVDNKNTDLLSKHTKEKQAHLASRHNETNAVMPVWSSFGEMIIPKVSIDHQGFAGTITHTDGDDTEEKTERNIEFMYITTNITHQQTWSICSVEKKQQEWKQSWHSPEEFKHRLSVYWGVFRGTGVAYSWSSVMHIWSDRQDNSEEQNILGAIKL